MALLKAIIISPFSKYWRSFVLLLLILSLFNVGNLIYKGHFAYAIYVFGYVFFLSYVSTAIYCIIGQRRLKQLYLFFSYLFAIISAVINIVLQIKFDSYLSYDIIEALLGTNPNESKEFIESFIDYKVILLIISLLIVTVIVYIVFRKIKNNPNPACIYGGVLLTIISFCLILRNPTVAEVVPVFTVARILYEQPPSNLKLTNPKIIINEKSLLPENIVIIIGESFARYHSSLYGYEKTTNPLLNKLKENGSLFVYNDVSSPATRTINAFKSIMSTYKSEKDSKQKWYNCTTIIEIMKILGYQTVWISNQSNKALMNNVISKYANLCDIEIFTNEKLTYDEVLLDAYRSLNLSESGKKCVFFHLMGSHAAFNRRYPKTYDCFKADDYINCKQNQRVTLAEYDNSVLYNDYIVREIITLFEDKETIAFYFSDHGLDIYKSSDNYCSHGNDNNEVSAFFAKQIPFMIYLSNTYKYTHPNETHYVMNNIDNNFNTNNFIYSLMDITGTRFANNDDVQNLSLFSDK